MIADQHDDIDEPGYDPTDKAQVFRALRQEILAARLNVTLDEQLGRQTSTEVLQLSRLKPPPVSRSSHRFRASKSDVPSPKAR